jgi:transcription termination factor NusB
MKKIILLLLVNVFISLTLYSQENPSITIGLKDNHYTNLSSILLTKNEKKIISADESGKILMFNTNDFSYDKTIRESNGIYIDGMRLFNNDSILMFSQKYKYSDGSKDSLIMLSLANNKILLKEQRSCKFLGNFIGADVIISNTTKNYNSTIEFFEKGFKKILKFETDKTISIAEISKNKKSVIYTEGDIMSQQNIIVRDVATNNISKKILIPEGTKIVHLFFDENSKNFYVISYIEKQEELCVYKGSESVNWNNPIFTVPSRSYASDTVISDTELNNEHTIIFTSSISTFQKPLVLKNKGDNFSATTLFSNEEDLHKNASHSLVLNATNQLLLFQAFNPGFFDIAGFYTYDLKNKKTIGKYPKNTTGFYSGTFLPNDNWMVTKSAEDIKFYTSGTFNNRYDKLNIKNYLEINHNIESIINSFFDKKKGFQIFLGKDKIKDSKYSYYKYDLINDKVEKLYDENKNYFFIADYNSKSKMLLLNEQEYTNQSGTPSRIIILSDGKSLEFSGTYKFSKFSENGNYLLTINKDNTAEVRQLPDNKVLYSEQLDNGNYDIISIGDSNFSINTNLIRKDKTSNCYTKTQIISIENDVVSYSVKDCLLISDVSYVNENMAMIIDNTGVVVNDKPLLFKGLESPKYISFNSDASKFMLSFKNGNIIVYETTTFQELGRMIHPDEKSHVFLDTKGNYFSNIDAKDYLWATKNNISVSLKSIDKETFKPEELLSIFGTPNKEYTKVLQKAVNLRAETKPKADEKTTKNSTNITVEELGKPNLYLLSIGVSDYKQSNYNLTFADKDALDITKIYGTLTDKEFINYQDKFFGDVFTLYDKKVTALKSVNKYLGSSYRSAMFFYSVSSDNKWLEQTNDKFNLWNFDQKTIDSIAIPKDFIHTSYDYDNKLFSTANGSIFSIIGSENKVLSYNCSTKKSKQYKLPDGEFTNYALIEEDQWLLFNYKHIDSTSTISLSVFDGAKNKTTQKLKINPHKYLNRSLNGEVKSIDVENYSSYIIPALRAVSSNGNYLLYETDNESLFFVDITQNNPKPIKINLQNVLNYSSKISIAPDGKTFCVLNYKDKTYTTTIIDMNGKPIETHTIENNDFAVKGISIIDANPKWIKQTDQLLKDGFFEMEDIKLLNSSKPVSFDKVFTANFVNENADSKSIKNSLSDFFQKTKSNDQVMIFMAGHGVLDSKNNYFFAPHDMDFEKPETNGIAFELIVNSLKNTSAKSKLLLLDSCHSGTTLDMEATNSNTNNTSPTSIKQRGSGAIAVNQKPKFKVSDVISSLFENFLSTSGITILSASSGSDVAYEFKNSGNGAFTASFITLLKERLNAGSILSLDAEKLKRPQDLNNEFISDFFKKVLLATDNKQVPDIREINDNVEIKIW